MTPAEQDRGEPQLGREWKRLYGEHQDDDHRRAWTMNGPYAPGTMRRASGLLAGGFFPGDAAKDRFAGGWHWEAAVLRVGRALTTFLARR